MNFTIRFTSFAPTMETATASLRGWTQHLPGLVIRYGRQIEGGRRRAGRSGRNGGCSVLGNPAVGDGW